MNAAAETLNLWIHKLEATGYLWPAIFVCAVIFALLMWLLLRSLRLWYWKVDVQADTLQRIDQKMDQFGQQLSSCADRFAERKNVLEREEATPVRQAPEEHIPEPMEEESPFCRSRTGKVYTEEELEELIKD